MGSLYTLSEVNLAWNMGIYEGDIDFFMGLFSILKQNYKEIHQKQKF